MIADGVLVQSVGVNRGTTMTSTCSPALRRSTPATRAHRLNLEPSPNGGRVNQGYDGDTPQAQISSASQSLQVINPAQFAKYEVGEQVPITSDASNVGQTQAVTTLNAGGPAIATPRRVTGNPAPSI